MGEVFDVTGGAVLIDGQDVRDVTQASLRGQIGMVPQDDVVHPQLTVSQALHYAAELVRPQGRAGGGVAGIKLAQGATVVSFTAVDAEAENVVVTVAGSAGALPGTQNGSVKVTDMWAYPAKGRATGGVRCHRFLRGEAVLTLGWAGAAPPLAASANGVPVDLPETNDKRDGSGVPAGQPIAAVASRS